MIYANDYEVRVIGIATRESVPEEIFKRLDSYEKEGLAKGRYIWSVRVFGEQVPFLFRAEDLKADGGALEIETAIRAISTPIPKSNRSRYEWHVLYGDSSNREIEVFHDADEAADRVNELWNKGFDEAHVIPVTP